jgi:hypothetical protein
MHAISLLNLAAARIAVKEAWAPGEQMLGGQPPSSGIDTSGVERAAGKYVQPSRSGSLAPHDNRLFQAPLRPDPASNPFDPREDEISPSARAAKLQMPGLPASPPAPAPSPQQLQQPFTPPSSNHPGMRTLLDTMRNGGPLQPPEPSPEQRMSAGEISMPPADQRLTALNEHNQRASATPGPSGTPLQAESSPVSLPSSDPNWGQAPQDVKPEGSPYVGLDSEQANDFESQGQMPTPAMPPVHAPEGMPETIGMPKGEPASEEFVGRHQPMINQNQQNIQRMQSQLAGVTDPKQRVIAERNIRRLQGINSDLNRQQQTNLTRAPGIYEGGGESQYVSHQSGGAGPQMPPTTQPPVDPLARVKEINHRGNFRESVLADINGHRGRPGMVDAMGGGPAEPGPEGTALRAGPTGPIAVRSGARPPAPAMPTTTGPHLAGGQPSQPGKRVLPPTPYLDASANGGPQIASEFPNLHRFNQIAGNHGVSPNEALAQTRAAPPMPPPRPELNQLAF